MSEDDPLKYELDVESIGLEAVGANRGFKLKFVTIQNHLNTKGNNHPLAGIIYKYQKTLQQILSKKIKKEVDDIIDTYVQQQNSASQINHNQS